MRWSEAGYLSQIVLAHALRQASVSLILDVRQKKYMQRVSLILQSLAFAPLLIILLVELSDHVIVKTAHENAFILIPLLSILALVVLGLFDRRVRKRNWLSVLIWVPFLAITVTLISSSGR